MFINFTNVEVIECSQCVSTSIIMIKNMANVLRANNYVLNISLIGELQRKTHLKIYVSSITTFIYIFFMPIRLVVSDIEHLYFRHLNNYIVHLIR